MNAQLIVIAKAPVPGRVKTRLCPPCTPEQAAQLAAAALADTLEVATNTPAERRVLLLDGSYPAPDGWHTQPQRGDGLAARLAQGFIDTAIPRTASVLIGMDTPQVTVALLTALRTGLTEADAVLGPAVDGGWWALALRDPRYGKVLAEVPMSQPDTGTLTIAALREQGLRVTLAPKLRDVDTIADLREVARDCLPERRFASAAAELARERVLTR